MRTTNRCTCGAWTRRARGASGGARLLMADLQYEIERAQWSSDGKSIYFLANMGVHTELFKVNVDSPKPEQITQGKHSLNGWTMSTAAKAQVYTASEPMMPGEI